MYNIKESGSRKQLCLGQVYAYLILIKFSASLFYIFIKFMKNNFLKVNLNFRFFSTKMFVLFNLSFTVLNIKKKNKRKEKIL